MRGNDGHGGPPHHPGGQGRASLPYAIAPHETLLDLLACGLSWEAARCLGFEEAQCLLTVQAHRQTLAAIDAECARVASLAFADPDEQRRALTALSLRAKALEHRFRRDYPAPSRT